MKLISIILLALISVSCKREEVEKEAPVEETNTVTNKMYSYLALGDSYTIGESVAEKHRWSVQLTDLLKSKGIAVSPPKIIAKTGWTTGELSNAIKTSNDTNSYDLVSLLIGVNNQYRGYSIEEFRTEFKELLKTCVKYAKEDPKKVIVLSIPDWGVTPYGASLDRNKIATEIDFFNKVAKEESEKAKITFIDITPASRSAFNDSSMVAYDNLHFSGKMYRKWAELALPKAIETLK